MEFWESGQVITILLVAALLLVGSMLQRIGPIGRLGIPASIISGCLALLLGDGALGLLPLNRAMTATGPAATALRRAAIGRPSVHRVPPGLERLGVAAKFDFGERLGNLDSPPRQEPSCSSDCEMTTAQDLDVLLALPLTTSSGA